MFVKTGIIFIIINVILVRFLVNVFIIVHQRILVILIVYELSSFLQSEVEETLKRIQSHKGVIGTLIINSDGKL